MKATNSNLKIGSQLYWIDAPEILAGIVLGFTPKRDVIIDFKSGNEIGKKNYSVKLANKFIIK
jgi:hypothetical protein